jgi:hypothetical protein
MEYGWIRIIAKFLSLISVVEPGLNSLVWSFTPSLLVLSTVNDSTVKSDDDIVAGWLAFVDN